jgi:hypothetical protein
VRRVLAAPKQSIYTAVTRDRVAAAAR